MKIEPMSSTPVPQTSGAKTLSPTQRAIAAFNASQQAQSAPQAQQAPVQNPSQVSPEELSAIQAPTQGQKNTSESVDNSVENSPVASLEATQAQEEPISSQFAVLARKEKALRAKALAQEQAIKAREEAFKAKEAELAAKEAEYKAKYIPRESLKNDPLSVLSEAGLSYDELTNMALNAPSPQEVERTAYLKRLEAKIAELESGQKKAQENYEKQERTAYNQALAQIRSDATELVSSDPSFETIRNTGSIGDVVNLIERAFKETGKLMTVEKAAQLVEDDLIEQALKVFNKTKKLQERVKASQTPKAEPQASPKAAPQQGMKTLTNNMAVSKPMSAREKAIAAFEGRLK